MSQAVAAPPPAAPDRNPRPRAPKRWPLATMAGVLALVPLANIGWDAATGGLGVEPVEALVRRTGWWALTLLVVTLAVTPVRRVTGWNRLIQIRRPVGVISFVYALSHFVIYVAIKQWFALSFIIEDILERPFITAGFITLCLLTPLAATSTRKSIRRLGGKKWRRLHWLIYPAALLGVLHYFWLVKADTRPPLVYAAIVIALLMMRLDLPAPFARKAARSDSAEPAPSRS
ncbi:MAG: sulfoxide reductase heme-binding subunit YedZ [Gemmatimonas sp.]|nr:sulfoxide reductase heme-binding subunit YedZ [Gemmatimonas sp.]